jgi:hypothetical protein
MQHPHTHRTRTFTAGRSRPAPIGFGLLFDRAVVGVLGSPATYRPKATATGDEPIDQTIVPAFSPR